MKPYIFILCFIFFFSSTLLFAQSKPNIIFILVDDFGYGDLGVLGQNERKNSGNKNKPYQLTPNLDALAASGALFTQQYCNAPVCAPSRASLLTGVNQSNAKIRDNQFDRDLENNHTIATVLKQAGYATYAIGKWGLQGINYPEPSWPAHPLKRGFDNYFGYIRHRDGHEHYPHEGLYRGKKQVWENYKEISAQLAKCYTTDLFTAYAKKQIIEHNTKKQPFFMYLAYDSPHAVLELSTQAYPSGKGKNGGLQWLGKNGNMINTASGTIDSYIYPEYANATYDDDKNPTTENKPWPNTYKRYATANRRIDDAVGDIVQLLKDLNIYDSTLIVFTTDNGPSAESYLPDSFVQNQPTFFGSPGPFDGMKRDCWEGGVRVPTIASWPGKIAPSKTISTPSILSDWLATFADVANIPIPAKSNGVSLLPAMTGNGMQVASNVYIEYYSEDATPDFEAFEPARRNRKRGQMQLLRDGNIVGVRYHIKSSEDMFEIYDVVNDPKQTNNLANREEYKKYQPLFKERALQTHLPDTNARRPYDDAFIPNGNYSFYVKKKITNGFKWNFFEGNHPWTFQPIGLDPSIITFSNNSIAEIIPNKAGMMMVTGFINIKKDGKQTFSLNCSTSALVKIHEITILETDFNYKPNTTLTQSLNLKKGLHPIVIYFLTDGKPRPTFSLVQEGTKNLSLKCIK